MEMGFPEDVCVEALERYDGDEQLALNFLLGGWDINFDPWLSIVPMAQANSLETVATADCAV